MVHNAGLLGLIVDGVESGKSLQRPGMERLLTLVDGKRVQAVIVRRGTSQRAPGDYRGPKKPLVGHALEHVLESIQSLPEKLPATSRR